MIFEHNTCKKCKSEMFDTKILLNHILPSGICNSICDYHISCRKCKDLIAKQNEFIETYLPQSHSYTKVELQMLIVDKYFPFRISLWDDDKIKKYHIDQIFDKDDVKKRFIKQESIQAIKSFCKKTCSLIRCLICLLIKKKDIQPIVKGYKYHIFN